MPRFKGMGEKPSSGTKIIVMYPSFQFLINLVDRVLFLETVKVMCKSVGRGQLDYLLDPFQAKVISAIQRVKEAAAFNRSRTKWSLANKKGGNCSGDG